MVEEGGFEPPTSLTADLQSIYDFVKCSLNYREKYDKIE